MLDVQAVGVGLAEDLQLLRGLAESLFDDAVIDDHLSDEQRSQPGHQDDREQAEYQLGLQRDPDGRRRRGKYHVRLVISRRVLSSTSI